MDETQLAAPDLRPSLSQRTQMQRMLDDANVDVPSRTSSMDSRGSGIGSNGAPANSIFAAISRAVFRRGSKPSHSHTNSRSSNSSGLVISDAFQQASTEEADLEVRRVMRSAQPVDPGTGTRTPTSTSAGTTAATTQLTEAAVHGMFNNKSDATFQRTNTVECSPVLNANTPRLRATTADPVTARGRAGSNASITSPSPNGGRPTLVKKLSIGAPMPSPSAAVKNIYDHGVPRTPRTPGMKASSVRAAIPLQRQKTPRRGDFTPSTTPSRASPVPTIFNFGGSSSGPDYSAQTLTPLPPLQLQPDSARQHTPTKTQLASTLAPPRSPMPAVVIVPPSAPSQGGFVALQLPPRQQRKKKSIHSDVDSRPSSADSSAHGSPQLTPFGTPMVVSQSNTSSSLPMSLRQPEGSPILSPSKLQRQLLDVLHSPTSPNSDFALGPSASSAAAATTADASPTSPYRHGPAAPVPSSADTIRRATLNHLLASYRPNGKTPRSPGGYRDGYAEPNYSVIKEETTSYLHSSNGSQTGTNSKTPLNYLDDHSGVPNAPGQSGTGSSRRIGTLTGRKTSSGTPQFLSAGWKDSRSFHTPNSPNARSSGASGDSSQGLQDTSVVSATHDVNSPDAFCFDELPTGHQFDRVESTKAGRQRHSSATSNVRRLSDDYSTYKQKQIAARQQKQFKEKMRFQMAMDAGLNTAFLGALASPELLPYFFIHPASTLIKVWRILLMVLVWYSCFETSFVVAFNVIVALPHTLPGLVICNLIVDAAMIVDIFIYSRKGFYDATLELHSAASSIRREYLRTWLIPDLIAAMPLEFIQCLIVSATSTEHEVVVSLPFQLLKLGRLLKLLKVIKFSETRKSLEINEAVRAFFAFVYLLLIGHLVACGWYLLARLETLVNADMFTWATHAQMIHEDNVDQYVQALYWSLATLINIGFGGTINPRNTAERIYTICVVVFAALAYASVISNFMMVIENLSHSARHHEMSIANMHGFMSRHNFPPDLIKRVFDFQSTTHEYLDVNIGKHISMRPEEEEAYRRKGEEERMRTLMRHETMRIAKRERKQIEEAEREAIEAQAERDAAEYGFELPGRLLTPLVLDSEPPAVGSAAWLDDVIDDYDDERSGARGALSLDTGPTPGGAAVSMGVGTSSMFERSEDRVLSTMPTCYSLEINLHLHGKLIYNIFLFRDLHTSVLSALTKELRTRLYVRDDFITKRKLMGRRMYLVKRGAVERIEYTDLAKRVALAAKKKREEQAAKEAKEEEQRELSLSSQPSSLSTRLKRMRTRPQHPNPQEILRAGQLASAAAAKPITRLCHHGYHFGESSFLHGWFDQTVRVASPVAEVCVLEYSSFLLISEAFPEFARCVLGSVERQEENERNRALNEQRRENEQSERKRKTTTRKTSLEQQLHGAQTQRSPLQRTHRLSGSSMDAVVESLHADVDGSDNVDLHADSSSLATNEVASRLASLTRQHITSTEKRDSFASSSILRPLSFGNSVDLTNTSLGPLELGVNGKSIFAGIGGGSSSGGGDGGSFKGARRHSLHELPSARRRRESLSRNTAEVDIDATELQHVHLDLTDATAADSRDEKFFGNGGSGSSTFHHRPADEHRRPSESMSLLALGAAQIASVPLGQWSVPPPSRDQHRGGGGHERTSLSSTNPANGVFETKDDALPTQHALGNAPSAKGSRDRSDSSEMKYC